MLFQLLMIQFFIVSFAVAMEDAKKEVKCLRNGAPLLFTLIRTGNDDVQTLRTTLEFCSVDVNEEYKYSTPLIEAVEVGSKPLARMLYYYGALLEPATGGRRLSPLKKAVECENLKMVTFLVDELKADVDYADNFYKETALYVAVARAQIPLWSREKLLPIIDFLINRGANCNKPNCQNITPLNQAERTHDSEVINILKNEAGL